MKDHLSFPKTFKFVIFFLPYFGFDTYCVQNLYFTKYPNFQFSIVQLLERLKYLFNGNLCISAIHSRGTPQFFFPRGDITEHYESYYTDLFMNQLLFYKLLRINTL